MICKLCKEEISIHNGNYVILKKEVLVRLNTKLEITGSDPCCSDCYEKANGNFISVNDMSEDNQFPDLLCQENKSFITVRDVIQEISPDERTKFSTISGGELMNLGKKFTSLGSPIEEGKTYMCKIVNNGRSMKIIPKRDLENSAYFPNYSEFIDAELKIIEKRMSDAKSKK